MEQKEREKDEIKAIEGKRRLEAIKYVERLDGTRRQEKSMRRKGGN